VVGLRIVGFFKGDELGAPFLVATMVMEDLGIKSPLEFLIDTMEEDIPRHTTYFH